MAAFFSCFIFHSSPYCLPGRTGWFSSNFSTAAAKLLPPFSDPLGHFHILFFHLMMKEILNQDAQSPQKARLLFLTDLAAWMLLLSVFFPICRATDPLSRFSILPSPSARPFVLPRPSRPRSEILSFGAGAVFPAVGGFAWFLPDGLSIVFSCPAS